VLLDIVIRRQIESPRHGLVVHRAEQRLDSCLKVTRSSAVDTATSFEDATSRADPPVRSPSSYATDLAILYGDKRRFEASYIWSRHAPILGST
jgi:hypothetical protein